MESSKISLQRIVEILKDSKKEPKIIAKAHEIRREMEETIEFAKENPESFVIPALSKMIDEGHRHPEFYLSDHRVFQKDIAKARCEYEKLFKICEEFKNISKGKCFVEKGLFMSKASFWSKMNLDDLKEIMEKNGK